MEPSEQEPINQPSTTPGTNSPPQPPADMSINPSSNPPQSPALTPVGPDQVDPPTDAAKPEITVGSRPATDSNPPKPPRDNKKLVFVLGVVGFIAAVGGYIFGMYLPSQPDYVWSTGLSNSGKVIEKVTDKLTEKNNLEKVKKTELIITGDIKGDGYDYSANLNSKFDDDKSTTSANVNAGDGSVEKLDLRAEILTEIPAGKIYPDIYFKVSGLKNVSQMDISDTYGEFDDKWFHVSSQYLESIYQSMGGSEPKKDQTITSSDTAEFIKIISKTNQEYLFTSDKNKAVLINKGFKGKETVNGVQAFKYEVGVDKQHAKDYCRALTNRLLDSALVKKLAAEDEESLKDSKADVEKDCNESADDFAKEDEKLEAWVDTKHRIIHKIRKYSGSDKTVYTEVGQIYKGGDNLSVFFVTHNDAEQLDTKLTLDLDSKDLISKGTYTATKKSDKQFEIKATIEVKPHSGEVKVVKPEGAIDIRELLGDFMTAEDPVETDTEPLE